MWTIVAFLNPQSFIWAGGDAIPWAMVVAIPSLAGLVVFSSGNWSFLAAREIVLMLILWAWFTITTIVSTHTPLFMHHAADTWYRWGFVGKILFMTLITVVIVCTFERLRWFVIVMASCFAFFVVKGFPFLVITGGAHRLYGPERSMIADNNDFGLALNMSLPLFFFLAQTETNPWLKRMWGAIFLMTIPAIFFTYSRGALVGLITISLLMVIQLKQRFILIPVIALGVSVAIMFAPESWRDRMDPTKKDAVDASARARLNAWAFARALAAEYPVAGGGFATFTPELFPRYAPNGADIHGPHSVYFQILGEHGYMGLLLYLSLLGSSIATARSIISKAKRRGDIIIVHYANMFQFSLVGFSVCGIFLGRAYFDYYFSIVACLVTLKQITRREWAAEDAENAEAEEAEEIFGDDEHAALPGSGRLALGET